jgi:hypothetical protein
MHDSEFGVCSVQNKVHYGTHPSSNAATAHVGCQIEAWTRMLRGMVDGGGEGCGEGCGVEVLGSGSPQAPLASGSEILLVGTG